MIFKKVAWFNLSNTCRLMFDLANTDWRRWTWLGLSANICCLAFGVLPPCLQVVCSISLGLESPIHQILLLQWRSSISLLMTGWCHVFYPNRSPQQMIKAAIDGTFHIRMGSQRSQPLGNAWSVANVQCRELEDHGPGRWDITSFNNGTGLKTR